MLLGIVLTRQDAREADERISVYTREMGKIQAFARGTKKIKSKNSAHLEPFSVVELHIVPGKNGWQLIKVRPISYFSEIRKNIGASLAANNFMQLCNMIIKDQEPDSEIFDFIFEWLHCLKEKKDFTFAIDLGICDLLNKLGYGEFEKVEDKKIFHKNVLVFACTCTDLSLFDWEHKIFNS